MREFVGRIKGIIWDFAALLGLALTDARLMYQYMEFEASIEESGRSLQICWYLLLGCTIM